MHDLSGLKRLFAFVVLLLVAQGCSISTDDLTVTRLTGPGAAAAGPAGESTLPILGPVPASSHWHAAYVVRVCDDVLDPFGSADDPLGIHSHADGLMHVHPFVEQAGYESATLGVFADAMGFTISEGELTLPGGGTWRDGDECNGVPGRVFVDRWQDPSPNSAIERIFTDLENVRYLADGELYQIAFAPADSPPVVPPAFSLLGEVSNLAPPPPPWIDVDETATIDDVQVWQIATVSAEPCDGSTVPERVLSGTVRCFEPSSDPVSGADAVLSARAVLLNRRPAIDMQIGPAVERLIADHFQRSGDPIALAIEVDGYVLTAPQIVRPPATPDRLVVSGGFSEETAKQLAAILNS